MGMEAWSTDELKKFIDTGEEPANREARGAAWGAELGRNRPAPAPEPVDTTYGMSGPELFGAGLGGEMNEIVEGLKEKGQLLVAPEGAAGDALRSKISADRASRKGTMEQLYQNPSAVAGQLTGKILPAVAAPARLGAQMALGMGTEFAKPGNTTVKGLPSELLGSAAHAGVEGATLYGFGKALELGGKALNAARGRYTPMGEEAMKTNSAVERLTGKSPTIGMLDRQSPIGKIEEALPGHAERIQELADALGKATGKDLVLPEGVVTQKGGAYADELLASVKNRLDLGGKKYAAVDDYITANRLDPILPKYSANTITATNNKGYSTAVDILGRYGFDAASVAGMSAKQLGSLPLAMSHMHEMRVAANRALNFLNRAKEAPSGVGNAEIAAAHKFVKNFKTAIDSDIEQWAKRNAGNAEAMKLYKEATDYWRDVVGTTVSNNPLAKRLLSKTRGFASPQDAAIAATSNRNISEVDLLRPTMSPRGEDMTLALRNLPEVRATMLDQTLPTNQQSAMLQLLRVGGMHPLSLAEASMPGMARSGALKRLHFAPSAAVGASPAVGASSGAMQRGGLEALREMHLPAQGVGRRAAWGALQYPQEETETVARRRLGLR